MKFDANGNRLWGTYYGSTNSEYGYAIRLDGAGNIFIAGYTISQAGIASGGFQNVYAGGFWDAFLVKFDATGNRLWSTYYGGPDEDMIHGLATDIAGNVYAIGETTSQAGITSVNAFQNTYGGGSTDAFVVKFNSAGNRLWATYYGGTLLEYGEGITVDAWGDLYFTGSTQSYNDVAYNGFQNTKSGFPSTMDAYLAKFDANGNRIWATYYGGTSDEEGYSVVTDATGMVYLGGDSYSATNISSGGFQDSLMGLENEFVAKFDSGGARQCATYYGQADDEDARIAFDGMGGVYLAGRTTSPSGLGYNGFQNTFGGLKDAYLVKFSTCGNGTYYLASQSPLCNGQCNGTATVYPFCASCPYTYAWNTTPVQTTATATGLCPGTYSVDVTDSAGIVTTTTFTLTQPQPLSVLVTAYTAPSCNGLCDGTAIASGIGGTPVYAYSWNTTPVQTTSTAQLCGGTYTVDITDNNGCTASQTFFAAEPPPILLAASATPEHCGAADASANVTASGGTPGYVYDWSNNATSDSITGISAGTYSVNVTDINGCTLSTAVIVPGTGAAVANAGPDTHIIEGETTVLTGSGGILYVWSPPDDLSCDSCAITDASPPATSSYILTVTDSNGCTDSDTVTVYVDINCGEVFVPNAFSPNDDHQNDVLLVRGKCIDAMDFRVYNRWGELVFGSTDIGNGWDGIFRGQRCAPAVFVYTLEAQLLNGGKVKKSGNVSLVR